MTRIRFSKPALIGLLTVVACGAWLFAIRLDGFIPADEGLLGQTAERVLQGELPHVDFDDPYTGGLAMTHAAVFRVFGVRSAHLRGLLLAASLLFVASFFLLLRPATGPWAAAGLTALAIAWSLACYFAALPSWYNLFCAVFALLALQNWHDDGRRRWLLAAGLCAGLSMLVKVVGLFLLGGTVLTVVHTHLRRRTVTAGDAGTAGLRKAGAAPDSAYPMPLAVGALALGALGGILLVLRPALSATHLVYYALPIALLAALVWREERRPKNADGRSRWRELWPDVAALAAGYALPIALFLIPYLRVEGGLRALWLGVFVAPASRVELAAYPLPPLPGFLPGLLVVALIAAAWRSGGWRGLGLTLLLGLPLAALGARPEIYLSVWRGVRALAPLVVIVGGWRLLRHRLPDGERLFASLAALAFFNLVQFPLSRGIYFCFVAPLIVLALSQWAASERALATTGGAISSWTPRRGPALAAAGLCLFLFAALWLHRVSLPSFAVRWVPRGELEMLLPERVGLRVPLGFARGYGALAGFIDRQVPPEVPILALPDAPQVYFFSARRNPTPFLYDALSARRPSLAQRQAWLEQAGLVVINHRPEASPQLDPTTLETIYRRFPRKAAVESLEVRYRDKVRSP
jgi:hypothetical protein